MECQDRHRLPSQFATRLAASLSPFESMNLYEEMPQMRLCLALKNATTIKSEDRRRRLSQEEKALLAGNLY